MTEIERKFLITSEEFKKAAFRKTRIKQGYLNSDPDRTVRVRLRDGQGFLTVKGRSSENGLSRFEWEREINSEEAEDLLKLCEAGVIDKIRYEITSGKHIFEVDEFFGENEGLLLAEVELSHENEEIEKPDWLGKEVTGDKRYYNAFLSKNPFKTWNK
ncbi:CYTH domain-containing protein [Salinimicrobium soli]|uniref:CYTH domain-containing protein n=1 Tax=Salinimicrobium soli TaxID=1254399 RepID=UPI003AAFAF4C